METYPKIYKIRLDGAGYPMLETYTGVYRLCFIDALFLMSCKNSFYAF